MLFVAQYAASADRVYMQMEPVDKDADYEILWPQFDRKNSRKYR